MTHSKMVDHFKDIFELAHPQGPWRELACTYAAAHLPANSMNLNGEAVQSWESGMLQAGRTQVELKASLVSGDTIHSLSWHPTVSYLVVLAVGVRVLACYVTPDQDAFGEEVTFDPLESINQHGVCVLPFTAQDSITTVHFSEDGLLLACGGRDGKVWPHT